MANNNDEKILLLKKQIEEEKVKLGKSQKFSSVTNCILNLDGVQYNLQTFNSKEQIIPVLVKLNAYAMSAEKLGLTDVYTISGYKATDWILDLNARLDFVTRKERETKLKAMESKLDLMLSEEKKTELELNEIESLLKS